MTDTDINSIVHSTYLVNKLIGFDNQFSQLSDLCDSKDSSHEFMAYVHWLEQQPNPPKSYRNHPIDSEEQLNHFKKEFEAKVESSLGAYLRIKRAYFILNTPVEQYPNFCEFTYITTPIGMMLAVFHEEKLSLLEFIERKMLETELKQIQAEKSCNFVFKHNQEYHQLQKQIDDYFAGNRKQFNIALDTIGTEFQKQVWSVLQSIDYGTTVSYQEESEIMGKPTAMRAVANANGKNKISIIIPCHRVIRKNGDLGGYGGGVWRKRFLLNLEEQNKLI